MYYQNEQVLENMVKGWTRIEMLIALYDRAIGAVEEAKRALESEDSIQHARCKIEANKFILGLLSGLDSENCKIAFSVQQLLVFVMQRIDEKKYDDAIRFLGKLKHTFEQIRDEAASLEQCGKIPPLADANVLDTVA